MATTSTVLTDDTRLSRFDRAILAVESRLNLLGGVVILLLVVLAVANVVGRKIFNAPVYGYVDWTEQFMAIFAFLGLAYCQREGGHIRMDILVMRLRGQILWAFEWVSTVFMLLVTLGLIYGSWHHFLRAFDWDAPFFSSDSSIDIGLPTWPAKALVPVALGLLAFRLMLQLWAYGRAFQTNASAPVAVPLPEDTMGTATREARTVSGARDG